jgi:hypothetical protein
MYRNTDKTYHQLHDMDPVDPLTNASGSIKIFCSSKILVLFNELVAFGSSNQLLPRSFYIDGLPVHHKNPQPGGSETLILGCPSPGGAAFAVTIKPLPIVG